MAAGNVVALYRMPQGWGIRHRSAEVCSLTVAGGFGAALVKAQTVAAYEGAALKLSRRARQAMGKHRLSLDV